MFRQLLVIGWVLSIYFAICFDVQQVTPSYMHPINGNLFPLTNRHAIWFKTSVLVDSFFTAWLISSQFCLQYSWSHNALALNQIQNDLEFDGMTNLKFRTLVEFWFCWEISIFRPKARHFAIPWVRLTCIMKVKVHYLKQISHCGMPVRKITITTESRKYPLEAFTLIFVVIKTLVWFTSHKVAVRLQQH